MADTGSSADVERDSVDRSFTEIVVVRHRETEWNAEKRIQNNKVVVLHPLMATEPEIPPDITFFHILPRIPAKSILCFKCVCKQWHTFLSTPMFKKLHFGHHIKEDDHHNPNVKLLLADHETKSCKFYTIDCESPEHGLTSCSALRFEPNVTAFHFLTSFHGLVCIGIVVNKDDMLYESEYSDIILWNPLTNEYKTLSKGNYHHECYKISGKAFGLYYTSFDDDYKLVRLTDHDIYIYSLKTDSWRKVGSLKYFICSPNSTSIWLNEKLYFLKQLPRRLNSPIYIILRFDTKTEKLIIIATPNPKNIRAKALSFSVVGGCIQLCIGYYDQLESYTDMELWRMNGDEDGQWTKVAAYNMISCLPPLEKALHVMMNGNWLMHSSVDSYFYQVDLEKDIKDVLYSYAASSMHRNIVVFGKFVETLVSPNQYTK